MKWIDSKGKLFGIINVFDLFVLIVLVIAIVFSVRWIQMADDPTWVKVEVLNTRCFGVMQVPTYVAALIKDGDEILSTEGEVVGRIEKVLDNQPSSKIVYHSKEGDELVFDSEARNVSVNLVLSSYAKKGQVFIALTNDPLKVGSQLAIQTKNYCGPVFIHKVLGTER